MTIAEELSKPEYQTGTYAERLELLRSKSETVVGKISYGNTLHLVSMLARGLRSRIDNCLVPSLKNAWSEALNPAYLASPAYSVNVSLPEIRGMIVAGLQEGICTQEEHDFILSLATFSRPLFPDATLVDVVAHFEPALVDVGEWRELDPGSAKKLRLKLLSVLPEPTSVVVQMQELDGEWSDWFHATAVHGVQLARSYTFDVPHNGLPRKFRWRGSVYAVDGAVTAI